MIEFLRLNDATTAHQLAHILRRRGIGVNENRDGDQFVLELEDAGHHDQARAIAESFLRDPGAREWQEDAWRDNTPARGLPRQPLFSGGWFASLGPVTRAILIICVLVYLSQWVVGDKLYMALLFPAQLSDLAQQPWRLLTPMLLHFSVLHILFNMLWWCDLGRVIERFQSSLQLLVLTLLVAAVSNLAQFLDTGRYFGGLSGVVYGLLGYLWLYGKVNPAAGYQLRREVVILMVGWLVLCYVGLSGIVANAAHLAGLISGAVLGILVGLWRRYRV